MAKQTQAERATEPMVEVIAASSFRRANGSYVHKGERVRVPAAQADELKAMRLASDP